jgi:nucleotide-binding universal stress UspA family protein
MYKNILLASDGSEHALRASDHAFHLASCNQEAVVEILYVINRAHAKSSTLQNWNSPEGIDVNEENRSAIELKAKKADIPYQVTTLEGEPGPTIVEYANQGKFDVVVIGSRGLNGLQEMVLGSVSHKVAKRVHCPVLIIK